jgi:nitrate reductase (cytochrome), electron transfer subunit
MPDIPAPQPPGTLRRNAELVVVIVVAVTLVGFLSGIKEPPPIERPAGIESAPQQDRTVPEAARYADLSKGTIRPDSGRSDLSALLSSRPGPFDPVVRTDEMKMLALEDRAKWRAFDGAPPIIPHPVDFMQTTNCIACHGSGVRVGDKLATKISHRYLSNCTQCHVEHARPEFASLATPAIENAFIGPVRSGPGERAWPGAPPTIPHTTWMRQDCTSCHGLVARPGIRTTHPWLTNCTQCHAPSAALDQVDFPFLRSGFSR